MSACSPDLAFLFPGQGAHRPEMLDGLSPHPVFASRYALVAEALGGDPASALATDPGYVNRNLVSSLATVLVSSLAFDAYRDTYGETAGAVAGYSVGQWTALWAAGSLSFERLVAVVVERARCLDACAEVRPGGMLAVSGVSRERLEALCATVRAGDEPLFVSNDNCPGSCSLAGSAAAIEIATSRVQDLEPRQVVRLPVAGAWHCPLMQPAEAPFERWLDGQSWEPPSVPVISNVTGDWLPAGVGAARAELVRQLSRPVLWAQGLRTLIGGGVRRCVELGFGEVLTQFGFFVDRRVDHRAYGGRR